MGEILSMLKVLLQRIGLSLAALAVLVACALTISWLHHSVSAGPAGASTSDGSTAEQLYEFDFSEMSEQGPKLSSAAVMLVDYASGDVLFGKEFDAPRPIASISKLVSAMVFLDSKVSGQGLQSISKEDATKSSRSRLAVGTRLTLQDLLRVSLLASDNRATRALARAIAGTCDSFVVLMNAKVRELGLTSTVFYDPTGLDCRNVSTAHEVAKILHFASEYPTIAQITSQKNCVVRTHNRRKRILQFGNTNRLIYNRTLQVIAGKTGYIDESAHCLATIIRSRAGQKFAVVVLGTPGDRLRFREVQKLVDWGTRHLSAHPHRV